MPVETPLRRLLTLALPALLLFVSATAFVRLPCWALPGVFVPVAWPIWAYHTGNALFTRRLWLEGVTQRRSRVRRWLARGWLSQAVGAVFAVAVSALLLPLAVLLRPEHWAVLALDVLLLALLIGPLQRRLLGNEVQPDKVGLIARRWPLMALNLVLLAAAFLVVDFTIGAPDTRGLPWHSVADYAFEQSASPSRCQAAGWLTGTLAAIRALAWHASVLIVPSLPDPALKLGAWTLLLAQVGLFGWLFTSLLLGTLALVEQRLARPAAADGSPGATASTAFVFTILALAVPYLYAVHKLRSLDPAWLARQAEPVVRWTNPCRADTEVAGLARELDTRFQQARADALRAADRRIDDELEAVFHRVDQGVEAYLDWYFTVVGEYERLAALAVGDFGALMARELEDRLFDDTGFVEALQRLSADLEAEAGSRLDRLVTDIGLRAEQSAADHPCAVEIPGLSGIGDLAGLGRDVARAGTSAGAGTAAGAVTAKLLAKKTAGAVTAKLAGKKSFQVAAALAGKAAAKKGGSAIASALGGAAVCAPSGPWAVLCGVGAGVAAWLAVDKAMIEIDEVRFRDEMRADLLETVAQQRALLTETLKARQRIAVDARLGALAQRLEQKFVPLRDGL